MLFGAFYNPSVSLRLPPPFTQGRLFVGSIITQIGRENNISAEICLLRVAEDVDPYKCCVKYPYEKERKTRVFSLNNDLYPKFVCHIIYFHIISM